MNLLKRWEVAVLLTVLLVGTWRDASMLLRYPVATGFDGYYYVLQIETLHNTEHFQYPTSTPLVFYALAGLRYLTGDTIIAIKLGSLGLQALLCLGIFAIVASLTRSTWLGVLGCALAMFPSAHLFLLAEYVKNLAAVTALVWCGWLLIRVTQTWSFSLLIPAAALLLVALLSHRVALLLVPLIAMSIILIRRLLLPGERVSRRWLITLIILAIWLTPAVVANLSLTSLTPSLAFELSTRPHWPLSFVAFFESLLLFVLAPAVLIVTIRRRSADVASTLFGAVALWSVLVTLNPFFNPIPGWASVAGRIGGLAFLQVALLLPGLCWLLRTTWSEDAAYALAFLLPLVILSIRAAPPYGLTPAYLTRRMFLLQSLAAQRHQFNSQDLVIARHGDQFVVTYALGVPAQQRLPPNTEGRTIFWLLDQVDCQTVPPLRIALQIGQGQDCATLIENGEMRRLLVSMTVEERQNLLTANPHLPPVDTAEQFNK